MGKEFFISNRKRIIERLKDKSILIVFAGEAPQKSADENYSFTPNRNFYYLTGINREKMIIMISKFNDKIEETLFIEKSDPVLAKWIGERMSMTEAENLSGIADVQHLEAFEGKLNRLMFNYDIETLYLDLERRSYNELMTETQTFAKKVLERYPQLKIKNIYNTISELRLVKSGEEIENIKTAIDITQKGIYNMMKNSKPEMMEYEIEAYFDFTLKCLGVKDFAFKTIAASGINGTILHYSENNSKTSDGDLILCDLGAQWNYYNADITRTFPVNGKFTERQKTIYNIVLEALKVTTEAIRPGIPFARLNEITKEVLAEGLKKIGVIKEGSELSKYYYHGVSHYLGLDTHDVGSRETDLKPGMVLTVEPGLYIEEEKIGIRIEDDVMVTEAGYEVLSKNIIRTVEEIEEFMNR